LRGRNAPAQTPHSLLLPFPWGGKGAGGMGALSKGPPGVQTPG